MFLKKNSPKRLGQCVSQHVFSGDMDEFDVAFLNAFPDKVKPSVNVLGPGVVFWVPCQTFSTLIVDMNRNGRVVLESKFREESMKP